MMREILFRGKRMDNGEWVYGMPWIFKDHSCICPWKDGMCKYDTGFYPVQVEPSTVGQYTGLNDKNGKRIFEGDIIDQSGCRWIVGFQNSAFVASNKDDSIQFALFEQYNYDWDENIWAPPDYFEGIGNIYDNPEVLKGGAG